MTSTIVRPTHGWLRRATGELAGGVGDDNGVVDFGMDSPAWDALFGGRTGRDEGKGGKAQQDNDGDGDEDKKPGTLVEEGVKPKGVARPVKPWHAAIAEHELTHRPFRDGCLIRRKGSGRRGMHQRRTREEKLEYTNIVQLVHSISTIRA